MKIYPIPNLPARKSVRISTSIHSCLCGNTNAVRPQSTKLGAQYLYANCSYGCVGYPSRIGILPEVTSPSWNLKKRYDTIPAYTAILGLNIVRIAVAIVHFFCSLEWFHSHCRWSLHPCIVYVYISM